MVSDAKKAHYPDRYGAWAGNECGTAPDYDRCCKEVWPNDGGFTPYQCRRKAAHGPDGAYCKTHDPAAVKARSQAALAKWDAKARAERPKLFAHDMLAVLRKIECGHNDPRGIASEIINKIEGR